MYNYMTIEKYDIILTHPPLTDYGDVVVSRLGVTHDGAGG